MLHYHDLFKFHYLFINFPLNHINIINQLINLMAKTQNLKKNYLIFMHPIFRIS